MARRCESRDPITIMYVIFGLACGGAEMVLLELIRGLNRERFRPVVLSLAPPAELSAEFERAGAEVYHLGLRRLMEAPMTLMKALAVVRRLKPDILHGVMFYGDLAARMMRLFGGEASVVSAVHSTYIGPRWCDYAMRWTDGLADAVTAVSDEVARGRRDTNSVKSRKLIVIPNGIDFQRVARPAEGELEMLRTKLGISKSETVLLSAGRLVPEKNHALLLRVFANLYRNDRSLRLLFVGTGALRGELEALATELGISQGVTFAGHVSPIGPVFHVAHVFVLSSSIEGLPMVVLEAMGAGLPMIATRVGGVPEVIEDKRTGLLVPPNDASALEAAIRAVLAMSSAELCEMRDAARREVRRRFGAETMVRKTEALYERVLAGMSS